MALRFLDPRKSALESTGVTIDNALEVLREIEKLKTQGRKCNVVSPNEANELCVKIFTGVEEKIGNTIRSTFQDVIKEDRTIEKGASLSQNPRF
ncbi:MAG: hypothetical protein H0U73_10935 [Tatlockia sp.]|nr:hypothetical protein [Tatlockia sp.]